MSYKRGLAVVSGCVIAALVSFAATWPRFNPQPVSASAPAAGAPASSSAPSLGVDLQGIASKNPLSWSRLTEAERVALAPFASQWDTFSDARKRKWIKIASRYARMSPEAQKRLHEQMTEWTRITPEQRRVARENYQASKELPREARRNAWKAYQQLPEEQKERLAASEHKRRPTVVSAPPTGKSEVKDIDRLVNGRGASAAAPALPALPASAASAAGVPLPSSSALPPGTTPAGSFIPATPQPVSPAEAPSIFNGS